MATVVEYARVPCPPPHETIGPVRGSGAHAPDEGQMLLDGHTASSVSERLGLSGGNLLYRWKREQLERSGPVATSLEARVRELESELQRVQRERDILKKALAIFGRNE